MRLKKMVAAGLTLSMVAGLALTGCGNDGNTTGGDSGNAGSSSSAKDDSKDSGSSEGGSVYYLNFKPEVAEQWEAIAKKYTDATGVEVKVVTAASGTYESTLTSEVAKKNPPTLFQINGPVGYQNWKDYCLDLSGTDIYNNLSDKSMAITDADGNGAYGIPYVVEGYGIIYNDEIMQKYFALSDKAVDISAATDIKDFDTLKKVVEDMTAHKADLGIEGVFSSTSFSAGEDWRWQTHLANVPVNYEYQDDNTTDKAEITFKYNENFKNIFDLYLDNSCTEKGLVGSKTVEDSMAEFALGKTAMVQNGNWGWGQVSGVDGNVVKEENVKFLPIYTGMDKDAEQSICIGTENFWCVNSQASEADQQATIDFLKWLTSDDAGKAEVAALGFITPFSTFGDDLQPNDPLAKEVVRYMNDSSLKTVPWTAMLSFPSQTFKDNFGASLLEYAQGNKEWSAVVSDMTADWAAEKANSSDAE